MPLCITIDADWALPEVAEYTLALLRERDIPCTYFATVDQSVEVSPLIEVAWHPNFSGQSDALAELEQFRTLFPGAQGIRPHRLYWGEGISADLLKSFGIAWTSASHVLRPGNQCPRPGLLPDFPIAWGDNFWFMENRLPELSLSDDTEVLLLNFHPIHVFLNTCDEDQYGEARSSYHDIEALRPLRNTEKKGVRDILIETLDIVEQRNIQVTTISQGFLAA